MKLTPRSEAIAYRVWAHCEPIGWNCTIREAAEAIGEPRRRVQTIVSRKGWGSRFRVAVSNRLLRPDLMDRLSWLD